MDDAQTMTMPPVLPEEWVLRGIGLRPEDDGDGPFLLDLFAAARGPEFATLGWPAPVLRQFLAGQQQLQVRHYAGAYPGAFRGIVTGPEGPVGRLYLSAWPGDIRIVDIALAPHWQGRGLGKALLRAVQATAAAARATASLSVMAGNPAHDLYRRLGFVTVAENGPALEMRWTG